MLKTYLLIFIALQHLAFLVLEMFFWTKPLGLKIFNLKLEQAQASAMLAANQGLYNGFLCVGLIWAAFHSDLNTSRQLALFFLGCVFVAGIFGAMTVSWRIFLVQGLPALIALNYVYFKA